MDTEVKSSRQGMARTMNLRIKSSRVGMTTDAAPCVDCETTGGYLGPNSKRPVRIKGRCTRCHDRHRHVPGKSREARPKAEPDRRYDVPTPLLLARYEALSDLRTPEAVEMADEIACRVDESRVKRLESERYVYLPDGRDCRLGFVRAARRYHSKFPPVRASAQSRWSNDFSLFVAGEVA